MCLCLPLRYKVYGLTHIAKVNLLDICLQEQIYSFGNNPYCRKKPIVGEKGLGEDKMHCILQAITRPIVDSLRAFLEEVFDQLENESCMKIQVLSQIISWYHRESSISVPCFFCFQGNGKVKFVNVFSNSERKHATYVQSIINNRITIFC